MNYKSKFSLSKFNKIFARRALLIGGPGVLFFIYFLLMKGKGQVLSDSTPDSFIAIIGILVVLAVTGSVFIAPAFYKECELINKISRSSLLTLV